MTARTSKYNHVKWERREPLPSLEAFGWGFAAGLWAAVSILAMVTP